MSRPRSRPLKKNEQSVVSESRRESSTGGATPEGAVEDHPCLPPDLLEPAPDALSPEQPPSNQGTQRDWSNTEDLRAALRNLYAFEHDGRHYFYAPFPKIVSEVNADARSWLERHKEGDPGPPDPTAVEFLAELEAAGLLGSGPEKRNLASHLEPFRPTELSLFLTDACNLACVYCYARGGESTQTLSEHVARRAIDLVIDHATQPKPRTVSVMFHGGGEVTLAFDLLERLVDHCKQRTASSEVALRLSLGTNGVMAEQQARWIAAHLNGATLSVDGGPDIHDAQRPTRDGRGSYRRVLRTARIWDKAGFRYAIRMTATVRSTPELPAAIERLCQETDCRKFQIEPLFPHGRARDGKLEPPPQDSFVEQFLEAHARAQRHQAKVTYSALNLHRPRDRFCSAVGQSFCVTPKGDVTSCYEVLRGDDPRAKLFHYGDWNDERQEFRFDHEPRQALLDQVAQIRTRCADCFCLWHCAGDCPAKSAWEGTTPIPDPYRCHITRRLSAALLARSLEEPQDP